MPLFYDIIPIFLIIDNKDNFFKSVIINGCVCGILMITHIIGF